MEVLISRTIDVSSFGEDTRQFLRDALADISLATGGWLDATFVAIDDPDPMPGDGQVSSTDHNPISLMSGDPAAFTGQIADKLSEFDLVATRAVYETRLRMGATRADFQEADLVNR